MRKRLTKEELVNQAIAYDLTTSKDMEEAKKEFRCHDCAIEGECKYAWDLYNIGDDYCLAEK